LDNLLKEKEQRARARNEHANLKDDLLEYKMLAETDVLTTAPQSILYTRDPQVVKAS
jgi:hypothetical protein